MTSEEPDIETRQCHDCGVAHPLTEYAWKNKARGWRGHRCRACRAAKARERYAKNGDQQRAANARYHARHAVAIAARKRKTMPAWIEANRERLKTYQSAWLKADYAANPEKYRQKKRDYMKRYPERILDQDARKRARKRSATYMRLSTDSLRAKWAYWAGRCWMCGKEATEWDHVKPIFHGGAHLLSNLRPACMFCNRSKQARWPVSTSIVRGLAA